MTDTMNQPEQEILLLDKSQVLKCRTSDEEQPALADPIDELAPPVSSCLKEKKRQALFFEQSAC